MTWPFETHQLRYGARIISVISRFSSPASLIRLGGFWPSPHFSSTIPRSIELASKEEDNCNNVTSGEFLKRKSWAESFRNGSHVTTIIQNFTLFSLSSSVTPHLVELLLGAAVPSLSTHSSPYTFVSLRTYLPTHLFSYVLILPLRPCTSRKNIPLRYLFKIVHLSRSFSIVAVCNKEVELSVGRNWRSSLMW